MAKIFKNPFFRQPKTILFPISIPQIYRKNTTHARATSINEKEMRNFEQLGPDWWNRNGPMKALHSLNSIRVPFIRNGLISTGMTDKLFQNSSASLSGVQILEVGCGAGILTEQLARTHAIVTGIDPSKSLIDIASKHVNENDEISKRIIYLNQSIEEHSIENQNKYDGVVLSEVLEHVLEKGALLKCCVDALKPGGSIFITTFDKTCLSYLGAIIIAENATNLVPKGTHNWDNFISPLDVQRILDENGFSTVLINGFMYELIRDKWHWIPTTQLSYALQAIKTQN